MKFQQPLVSALSTASAPLSSRTHPHPSVETGFGFRNLERNVAEVVDIWTGGQLVMDADFYSGQHLGEPYVDVEILEMIHVGLKANVHPDAARNFVCLIDCLPLLRASAFVAAFQSFWENGCQSATIEVRFDSSPQTETASFTSGDIDLFAWLRYGILMLSPATRATESIKTAFIGRHYREIRVQSILDMLTEQRNSVLGCDRYSMVDFGHRRN